MWLHSSSDSSDLDSVQRRKESKNGREGKEERIALYLIQCIEEKEIITYGLKCKLALNRELKDRS